MAELEVREIPVGLASSRAQIAEFLKRNGLRKDELDFYVGVFDENDSLIAGGGCKGNVIKCVAVSNDFREYHFANVLVSKLREHLREYDFSNVFVFTKAENKVVFASLGFFEIGKTDKAVMMESNPLGLRSYKEYLQGHRAEGTNGCIVMNCNPFTLGHRYLIEQAAKAVDRLHIILVKEGDTIFNYADRLELVKKGVKDLVNVDVCEGSDYVISTATFPNYFIKNLDEVSIEQVKLDLDIFVRHIAPSLNVSVRFMGSEPIDKLTALYNLKMHELLPKAGIETVEVQRLYADGEVVSASRVRNLIAEKKYDELAKLVSPSTLRFVRSQKGKYVREKLAAKG
ncbi:MAG: [citrate (pro-3S)-lyase] ligase [Clostridia bacterium]|nr:[citrate (pro-3S)-lyase] ligase [Clostridia bacterium]